MGEITGNRPFDGANVHNHGNDGNVARNGGNGAGGLVAKGIGLFKKMWLHLTGKVDGAHSKQLNNLRTQVGQRFDQKGLQDLEHILSQKGWNAPNSTKLMTSREINAVMSDLEVRGIYEKRQDSLMDSLTTDPEAVISNPKVLALIERLAERSSEPDDRLGLALLRDMQAFRDGSGDVESLTALTDPEKEWLKEPPFDIRPRIDVGGLREELMAAVQDGDEERIADIKNRLVSGLQSYERSAFEVQMRGITWGPRDLEQEFVQVVRESVIDRLKEEGFGKQLNNLGLG